MGLLNIFKGKSPQDYEEKGDSYAQFSAWGKAKIEYEKALPKIVELLLNGSVIPKLEIEVTTMTWANAVLRFS